MNPQTPGQKFMAEQSWQTPENAAEYRKKREPAQFHRFYREEAIINDWLNDLPKGGTILDLPCGTGRLVPTLTKRGFNYVGGDFSRAMIGEARQAVDSKLVHGFVNADATRLPFADNSVDCVFIWRLLHHVPDAPIRQAMLSEAARVTRNRVLITFHHPCSFTFLRKKFQRTFLGHVRHGSEITQWRLKQEADECGLRLVETRGFRKYVSVNWFACLAKKCP